MTDKTTPTPRTDNFIRNGDGIHFCIEDFARTLERELIAANARLAAAEQKLAESEQKAVYAVPTAGEYQGVRLREALECAVLAMRAPLDGWKGEVERKALDMARAALTANVELTGAAQADLVRMREAIQSHIIGCFDAAYAEGLSERLAELPDGEVGSIKDLIQRRILYALYNAQGLLATPPDRSALDAMLVAAKVEVLRAKP